MATASHGGEGRGRGGAGEGYQAMSQGLLSSCSTSFLQRCIVHALVSVLKLYSDLTRNIHIRCLCIMLWQELSTALVCSWVMPMKQDCACKKINTHGLHAAHDS